jgi:hypothetical protein
MSAKDRQIGDFALFDDSSRDAWENAYKEIMDKKYAKSTRNYGKKLWVTNRARIERKYPIFAEVREQCEDILFDDWLEIWNDEYESTPHNGDELPPVFLIPRERGGPSYKGVELCGADPDDVFYAPISKGYPMQDLSSFSLGPIVGHGLCLVNSAFSKIIGVKHIEGGGKVNLKRKNFWQRSRKPTRRIVVINSKTMNIDGQVWDIVNWLTQHEHLWLPEWEKWSRSIALCSIGDFHWNDDSDTVSFRYDGKYISFVKWKKLCYIGPSFDFMRTCSTFLYLKFLLHELRIPLGLVHPKAVTGHAELPITREYIRELFHDDEMCCQPFVIAACLLGMEI